MTTKRISLLIATILLPLMAIAQEAKLNKAKSYLDTSKGLQIEYQITIGNQSEQGSYYALADAFYLESEGLKAWHQGGNLWVYIPQNREVNLTNPTRDDLAELNPLLNLNGISSKNYQLKESRLGTMTTIKATPKKPQEIEWLEVTLDGNSKPLALRLKQRSIELPIELKVTKLQQATSLEMKRKDFFTYQANKLPGVAVIDLR